MTTAGNIPRTTNWHHSAVASYLLLIVLTLAWEGWLAPKNPPGFWLTVKSLPLLLPLFGLLRDKLRSHIIASLVLLLYLTEGLVLMWTERSAGFGVRQILPYAVAETLLVLVFILSASLHVRRMRVFARPAPPA